MRLPLPIPLALAAALACAAGGAGAQEGSVTYRCPNNDYKNTISAKEAERLGCKKLEGAPVTVIQMTKPRPQGSAAPAAAGATPSGPNRIDPQAQRARDSDARKILENELRTEEENLAALKREFNNGQPERLGNEQNYQKYVDRVAQLSAAITRKEADIAAIKRELQKLPAAPALPL
jgi:hypothetical protein